MRLSGLRQRMNLATSRALSWSGISMKEKLKKMVLNLTSRYSEILQKSMLQISTCLSPENNFIAFSVQASFRSTPMIFLWTRLRRSAMAWSGVPVPLPTSRKFPPERCMWLMRRRWEASVKKKLMKMSQMWAVSERTRFNIKNYYREFSIIRRNCKEPAELLQNLQEMTVTDV